MGVVFGFRLGHPFVGFADYVVRIFGEFWTLATERVVRRTKSVLAPYESREPFAGKGGQAEEEECSDRSNE